MPHSKPQIKSSGNAIGSEIDVKMAARTKYLLARRTCFVLELRQRNKSQSPDVSRRSQDINCCSKAGFGEPLESSEVRETTTAKEDMRSLLASLIVTLALAVLCCGEKGKGTFSWEGSWECCSSL